MNFPHCRDIGMGYHSYTILNIATWWTGSLINGMRWQSAEVVPPPRLASTFWPPWQGPNGTWNFGILGSDEDVDSYRIKQGGREYACIQWRYGVSFSGNNLVIVESNESHDMETWWSMYASPTLDLTKINLLHLPTSIPYLSPWP